MTNNTVGQINLFEALLRECLTDCRFQIACSSEQYGMVHEHEAPITEENPLRPLSTYAVSKIAQDFLGYQYWASYACTPSGPAASTTPARAAATSSSPATSPARWPASRRGCRRR